MRSISKITPFSQTGFDIQRSFLIYYEYDFCMGTLVVGAASGIWSDEFAFAVHGETF